MLVCLCILAGVLSLVFIPSFNDKIDIVLVTRVERVNYSDNGKYLVYCEDEFGNVIVFENTDEFLRGKVNSSDFYGRIKEGHKYRFTTVGWRIPLFDMYRNIIKMEEVIND